MAFPIRRDAIKGIIDIAKLSETLVDELSMELIAADMISDPDEIAEHMSPSLPLIPLDELKSIVEILYRLYYVREVSSVSLIRFIDDIIDGIRESSYSELQSENIDLTSLKTKFEKPLDIEKLKIILKATRLQSDGERLYCESKVLSDIRPVFDADPAIRPGGAVIVHTLKVTYHIGKELQEFHVVLNSHSLEALKDVINRACTKDKTLRDLMKEIDLSDLGE